MNPETLRGSYDRFADRYDEVFTHQQGPKITGLLDALPFEPEGPWLDAGAGTGLAHRLSGQAFVQLDLSRGMLRHAVGPRVQGRLDALPFSEGSFGLVLCVTALLGLVDPRPQIDELCRVLRPGGLLALSVLKVEDVAAVRAAMAARVEGVVLLDLEQDVGFLGRKA